MSIIVGLVVVLNAVKLLRLVIGFIVQVVAVGIMSLALILCSLVHSRFFLSLEVDSRF
jgi:hypothetical protein